MKFLLNEIMCSSENFLFKLEIIAWIYEPKHFDINHNVAVFARFNSCNERARCYGNGNHNQFVMLSLFSLLSFRFEHRFVRVHMINCYGCQLKNNNKSKCLNFGSHISTRGQQRKNEKIIKIISVLIFYLSHKSPSVCVAFLGRAAESEKSRKNLIVRYHGSGKESIIHISVHIIKE